MATYTLTQNENWSSISGSVVSGDTIDLSGYQLTFDAQPSQANIEVQTPGTPGTVVFSTSVVIPTWNFTGGTTQLIGTLPVDCEIGNITGGSALHSRGIFSNFGTIRGNVYPSILNATAVGIVYNYGVVYGDLIGSSGTNANAISENHGIIWGNLIPNDAVQNTVLSSNTASGIIHGDCLAGSGFRCYPITNNFGTINGNVFGNGVQSRGIFSNLGTINGNVYSGTNNDSQGVYNNYGIITGYINASMSNNGTVFINSGILIGGIDGTIADTVKTWCGSTTIVDGPNSPIVFPANIQTIYSIGPLSNDATLPVGATVIELNEGAAGLLRPRISSPDLIGGLG